MKKYKVVSIHYGNVCNREVRCKWCYTNKPCGMKNADFFIKLIPYLKKITEQVAIGSYGEPLLYPEFIKKFSKECKKNNLICNMTTNGDLIQSVDKDTFKDLNMVSISFNEELIKTKEDLEKFFRNVAYLKKLNKSVGCNLLVNKNLFSQNGLCFIKIVSNLIKMGVDYIYALYPKNFELGVDITKIRSPYLFLTAKYPNKFLVDDCSRCILENNFYNNWGNICHRGKDIISINPDGYISACSFANPFIRLNNPKDILNFKIPKSELGKNYCPFLKSKCLNS